MCIEHHEAQDGNHGGNQEQGGRRAGRIPFSEQIEEAENGKERKYYSITNLGKERLEEEKLQWEKFTVSVGKVIGGGKYAAFE